MEIYLFLLLGFIVWELVGISRRLQRIITLLEEQQRRPPLDSRFR